MHHLFVSQTLVIVESVSGMLLGSPAVANLLWRAFTI